MPRRRPRRRPDTIKPDMSDYPNPGMSDREAFKAWKREYMRRYRALNLEHARLWDRIYNSSPEGKARKRAYNNSPEGKATQEAYWNSAKGKATRKAYQNSPEGKARKRAYEKSPKGKTTKKAYDNSPEIRSVKQAYEKSPEGKATRKAYQNSPEGKATRKRKETRRRKAESMIPLTEQERQELVILEQKRLHLTETTGIEHHLDHIMPLARGGIHHPINLCVITAEENMRKGDKVTPEAMALIPQIQAIVNERKGWLNTEQDSTLADLFTTTEDET
jgi:hypothetical protein